MNNLKVLKVMIQKSDLFCNKVIPEKHPVFGLMTLAGRSLYKLCQLILSVSFYKFSWSNTNNRFELPRKITAVIKATRC